MAKAKKGSKTPKKSSHLTEVLNAVNLKQPCNYKPKEFNAWVLSLFLSEDPQLIDIVNRINQFQFNLDDEQQTEIIKDVTIKEIRKDSVGCEFERGGDFAFDVPLGFYISN
jgi:hypothetical protein